MTEVLIVEDEEQVSKALTAYLSALRVNAPIKYTAVETYDRAIEALKGRRYSLVIADLLLLPIGYRLAGGWLHSPAGSEPLTQAHWERYVVEEGGIGLVRRIRRGLIAESKTPTDVPIIVATYFDNAPGYMHITRRLEHENTVFLPKINKNPNYDLSGDDQLRNSVTELIGHVLFRNDIEGARVTAELVRLRVHMRRMEALRGNKHFQAMMSKKYVLQLELDLAKQPQFLWRQVQPGRDYQFQDWYEQWPLLRDEVLLNPKVGIKTYLRRREPTDSRLEDPIELEEFKFEPRGTRISQDERYRRRRLTLLAYLALATEPPAWLEGSKWALVSAGVGEALTLPLVANGVEQDVSALVDWLAPHAKQWVRDDVRELRIAVGAAAKRYAEGQSIGPPDEWAKEISDNFLISGHENDGYFFNGDLELVKAREFSAMKPEATFSQIALWPSVDDVTFACDGGATIGVNVLAQRLRTEFTDVVVLPRPFPEASAIADRAVLLNAPADEHALNWWLQRAEEGVGAFLSQLKQKEVKVIVAPSEAASEKFRAADFEKLAAVDVHVIHTQGLGAAIPEAKVIDTIICRDYRVKFDWRAIGMVSDRYSHYQTAPSFRELFKAQYKRMDNRNVLGDRKAGSASARLDGQAFIVTKSRSDKLGNNGPCVVIVESYDPLGVALTVGPQTDAPSSCSPWHAYLYAHDEDARFIIHTHDKASTYATRAQEFWTREYLEDGVWRTGPQILESLKPFGNHGAKIAVLRGHGAVAVGNSLPSCVGALIDFTDWARK